ncbi:8129_t:CDS:2, partial [Funneliformis geosporum]
AKKDPSPLTARKMRKVANYYIIDALCCQKLLVKLRQINDYREVASIAHVSLFDSHYHANGMKVRNLLSAYAFKCDMGIETRRPVTGLDFASLYPSLIMTYNLSPDKIILIHEEVDIAEKNGNILHKIEFPFNNRTDLFNMRVELKAHFAPLGKKKLQFRKIISSAKKRGKRILESLNLEYSSICFDYNYSDLKQRALKIYMNTFYGETGNSKSSIFLQRVWDKYGDTNSLYLSCPDKYYEKCDEAFSRKDLSKEAYWIEIVKITINVMKSLRDQVNAYLGKKIAHPILRWHMKRYYFPSALLARKCFGVLHEEVVNFRPDDLFMREIDTVKQGNSELFMFIREKIMWEAISINNTHSIGKIIEEALQDVKFKQLDFNQFIAMSK